MERLAYEQFVAQLRSALHYLYDPVHLRRSPLVEELGLAGEFDRAAALQHILTEAIHTLKPSEDEPPQSRAWRVYDLLSFQYIRQFDREVVAMQLGISERQLRREQRVALEALAQRLWKQFDLASLPDFAGPEEASPAPSPEPDQALSEELVWLEDAAAEQRIPLGETLQTVRSLAQPLAQQWQVPLQISIQAGLSDLLVAQLALRNILLTILSVAIPQAGHGSVTISAARSDSEIELSVACCDSGSQTSFSDKDTAGLDTARRLATFYGARLSVPRQRQDFAVTLTLPAPKQVPVLVIDDNADWLELLQRYVAGSRYHVIGTRRPETARDLAEKMQPEVIFLDVMMPNVDGWQILSELRHEPETSRIPVVICTILPVEGLALSLGVNAFLQKPVTQDEFLRTLDEQTNREDGTSAIRPALT